MVNQVYLAPRQLAFQENTSVNQFLIQLVSKQLTSWTTPETTEENVLSIRAKRANLAACRAVLAKVPETPVEELDRIES
jgi:hypothetical protein